MKFVGKTPDNALDKLASKKFEKYLYNDVKLEVPSEQYDGVKKAAAERALKCREQVQRLESEGKHDIAEQKTKQAEKYEKIEKSLRKSKVSSKDAMEARVNPKWSTIKDVVKISNRAGIEGAKYGAAIGGGMSLITNGISIFKGEKK